MSNHSFEYLQTFENLHLINQPLNEVKNILYQFFYFRKSGFPHTHQTHRDQPTQLREAQALPQWWSFTVIWIEAGDNSSRVTRQVQNRSRVTTSPGCLPELPGLGTERSGTSTSRILTVSYPQRSQLHLERECWAWAVLGSSKLVWKKTRHGISCHIT